MSSVNTVAVIIASCVFVYLVQHLARVQYKVRQLNKQLAEQAAALAASEHRRDLLFSVNPYPMWVYDTDTLRFVDVNQAATKAYGYSREEFLRMSLLDVRPQPDVPNLLKLLAHRRDGYGKVGISRHRRKDGSVFFAEIMAFRCAMDGAAHEVVLALDVTERLHNEQALQESEALLKSMVDNAPFGITRFAADQDRMSMINPALMKMLGGYSSAEALQLSVRNHLCGDAKDCDRLFEILRRSGKIQGWETYLRCRDGRRIPIRITGSVAAGEDGQNEVFTAYIEDTTQQSTLEQQVRQVQKLEAVGRLAGGMAHDFNNILLVVKLSTDVLLSQITFDSPLSKPLLQISKAADRAAALTRQMLAFSRQQLMQPRIINLNTVVEDTSRMLQRVIGEDIQLVTRLERKLSNSKLDPDQLTQVILNLAVNARDAMPRGGKLSIQTANVELDELFAKEHTPVQPGAYVMLSVTDTGTGIDHAVQPHIFDPFFTTKEVGKGTGLGLSIVYGIVKQSGGYIWVESEAGRGASFKVYFPVVAGSVDTPIPRSQACGPSAGETVLLVEDDATIRASLSDCLQQLGYQVLRASDAAEAMTRCCEQQGRIDLLLTDLVMSGKSGHELAADLVSRYPGIRVLFMSGYTESSAARREIMLKATPFLQKPFSVAELADAVRLALAFKPAELSRQPS